MNYKVTIFGVKDTTEEIVEYVHNHICPVDLIVTIHPDVLSGNQVSGYTGLTYFHDKYGIEIYQTHSYGLKDDKTEAFFTDNTFEIGISMGWQRLIPEDILQSFSHGIFGFHGSCAYLPFGRGRSPLNWSVINGDTRFILNLFRYDAQADSPNVFANEMCAINEHDTIRTMQYKNIILSKRMIKRLLQAYQSDSITLHTESRDYDGWYNKRTPADGKIKFQMKTRNIYNLVRGVTRPFPGAFAYCNGGKVTIWSAHPFDEMMDFSMYAPGEIIDVIDDSLIVRTIDGSLLIEDYESESQLGKGNILV
ncbi:MAG: formyltransferase family protein [Lachnospiraceae bacterium]